MKEHPDHSVHPLSAIAINFKAPVLEPNQAKPNETAAQAPRLDPGGINVPALLLDNRLCIVWQNEAARSRIWHVGKENGNGHRAPHLFDMLFDPRFQQQVDNWRQWMALFVRQAHCFIPIADLQTIVDAQPDRQRELLRALLCDLPATPLGFFRNHLLRQLATNGDAAAFRVTGTTFDTKRLIVFEPEPSEADHQEALGFSWSTRIAQRIENVRHRPHPVKTRISVLAAKLDNAGTLRSEMLDEEYSQLVSRIIKIAIDTLQQHGGIFCQHAGCGVLGFFLPLDVSKNDPPDAIQCALALKARMKELGREWKIRKGWLHDIALNIGIHAGNESIMALTTALGDHIIPLCDTQSVAMAMSNMALNGQIWATKALLGRMPSQALKELRFGVFQTENQRQVFVARCFTRMRDLDLSSQSGSDEAALAVAQIFDGQGQD